KDAKNAKKGERSEERGASIYRDGTIMGRSLSGFPLRTLRLCENSRSRFSVTDSERIEYPMRCRTDIPVRPDSQGPHRTDRNVRPTGKCWNGIFISFRVPYTVAARPR